MFPTQFSESKDGFVRLVAGELAGLGLEEEIKALKRGEISVEESLELVRLGEFKRRGIKVEHESPQRQGGKGGEREEETPT